MGIYSGMNIPFLYVQAVFSQLAPGRTYVTSSQLEYDFFITVMKGINKFHVSPVNRLFELLGKRIFADDYHKLLFFRRRLIKHQWPMIIGPSWRTVIAFKLGL